MSIYEVLSIEIPVIAYSVLHQHKKAVTTKEYIKSLNGFRNDLKKESERIRSAWGNHIADMTAKTIQTTCGNLSQFLSTPIQTDTGEINQIMRDEIEQTTEQLLPNILYGLAGGYDSRFMTESQNIEMPKARRMEGRGIFQDAGFKVGKNDPLIFESLYFVQGGSNLDIIENIMHNGYIGQTENARTKINGPDIHLCALYNLLFSDGISNSPFDRFELQVNFVKGKEPYSLFYKELEDSIKFFRTEIHHLNVSVWQRKLGIGSEYEFVLRILTKDRSTLRSALSITQKFSKDKNIIANSVKSGIWFMKEIV